MFLLWWLCADNYTQPSWVNMPRCNLPRPGSLDGRSTRVYTVTNMCVSRAYTPPAAFLRMGRVRLSQEQMSSLVSLSLGVHTVVPCLPGRTVWPPLYVQFSRYTSTLAFQLGPRTLPAILERACDELCCGMCAVLCRLLARRWCRRHALQRSPTCLALTGRCLLYKVHATRYATRDELRRYCGWYCGAVLLCSSVW